MPPRCPCFATLHCRGQHPPSQTRNCSRHDPTAQFAYSERTVTKKTTRARKRQTTGESIIEGLKQAVAWTKGENDDVRVTLVHVPQVDVRQVRRKMGLSQAQFAAKFGLPPATLRNWEQGRAHPDAPTRVLLAVIAKHPEAIEDVLRKAG